MVNLLEQAQLLHALTMSMNSLSDGWLRAC